MAEFIRNCWYVAAWDRELGTETPISRVIIGEPLALFRRQDGSVAVFEDRCPHRHAPLSAGRIEGDEIRCMYHGLKFNFEGRCVHVPGSDRVSTRLVARTFPAVEKWSWIWVWMGDPEAADPGLIPDAWGLDDPDWVMRESALDYAADYQLLNDNLLDLSHLDFVHEKSLGAVTGACWSEEQPQIEYIENGLHISRWLRGNLLAPGRPDRVDTYSRYSFYLPGIFIQQISAYPLGTADASPDATNLPEPLTERVDQQAVTPVAPGRSRYLYAHGIGARFVKPEVLDRMFGVINAAFAEDKATIEGQQKIWDQTDPACKKVGIPQDKAPARFRKMIADRVKAEQSTGHEAD